MLKHFLCKLRPDFTLFLLFGIKPSHLSFNDGWWISHELCTLYIDLPLDRQDLGQPVLNPCHGQLSVGSLHVESKQIGCLLQIGSVADVQDSNASHSTLQSKVLTSAPDPLLIVIPAFGIDLFHLFVKCFSPFYQFLGSFLHIFGRRWRMYESGVLWFASANAVETFLAI